MGTWRGIKCCILLLLWGCNSVTTQPLATPNAQSTLEQVPAPLPGATSGTWAPSTYNGLNYEMLTPYQYDGTKYKYPLVLFLHGSGEVGTNNTAQLVNGVELFANANYRAEFPAFVVAPQCSSTDTTLCWGGFAENTIPTPESTAVALVQSLMQTYSIDPARVYVTGLSMGGIGTWDMIYRYSNLFAAAMPLSGGEIDVTRASALAQIPIWAFHGAIDTIVPPSYDEAIYAAIQNLGGIMKYTEIPGVGHSGWDAIYANPTNLTWLFAQQHPQ